MIGFRDFIRLLEVDQNLLNQLNKIRSDIAVLDQRRAKLFIMQTQLEKRVATQNAQDQKQQQQQQPQQNQQQQPQQNMQQPGQQQAAPVQGQASVQGQTPIR